MNASKNSMFKTAVLVSTGEFVAVSEFDAESDTFLVDGLLRLPTSALTDFCL
jgi:hypothetical protein